MTQSFKETYERATEIWSNGGWAMIAIAVIALAIFALGVHVWVRLLQRGMWQARGDRWRRWLEVPNSGDGRMATLVERVRGAKDIDSLRTMLSQVRSAEIRPFNRDLRVMKICVSAAPLVGLLGTVTGMLATFGALSSSSGDQAMGKIASGISQALVTTETGLVVALPGLFFQYFLLRKLAKYKAFLDRLESVVAQSLFVRETPARRLAS